MTSFAGKKMRVGARMCVSESGEADTKGKLTQRKQLQKQEFTRGRQNMGDKNRE